MFVKKNFVQFLGSLEAEVMEHIWKMKQASVREIVKKLNKKKTVAYTTIMTVMARLNDKGILKRHLDKRGAYIYYPVQSKEFFLVAASRQVAKNFVKEFGEVGVAQFIDMLDKSDLKKIKEWKKKLRQIK